MKKPIEVGMKVEWVTGRTTQQGRIAGVLDDSLYAVDDQDRAKKWAEETKRKAVRFREVIE